MGLDVQKISAPKPSQLCGHEDVHFHPENPNSPGPHHLSFPPSTLFLIYECQWGNKNDTRFPKDHFVKVSALIVHTYSPLAPHPQNHPHIIPKNKNNKAWIGSTKYLVHVSYMNQKAKYKYHAYLNPTWPYILTLHKSSHALHL
jgi:hypothetical protein